MPITDEADGGGAVPSAARMAARFPPVSSASADVLRLVPAFAVTAPPTCAGVPSVVLIVASCVVINRSLADTVPVPPAVAAASAVLPSAASAPLATVTAAVMPPDPDAMHN